MRNSYEERLSRYVCAMRNEKPDTVPIRPFAAELTGIFSHHDCQQLTHDYNMAFESVIEMCKEFEFDAVVPNMVYVWTGLTHALGLKYYGIPGMNVPANRTFQYLEPDEENAFMRDDEYDELIDDPTAFLYKKWLPRVSTRIGKAGGDGLFQNNLALVKSSMAMLSYFYSFSGQIDRMRNEVNTPAAIAGIFKAPLDILGDKLRGYMGLTMDLVEQPKKVLKACEALMPHLCNLGLNSADKNRLLPIGFWMHRGCKPFVSEGIFESHYWATTKPIIEQFYNAGHQTLFYAEGDWKFHLESFRELPDASIVYHCDSGDVFDVHKRLGDKFCISGGIPNIMLAFSEPTEVRDFCRKVIAEIASDGGYIMDASSIMQNEIRPDNIRAMYEACKEFGAYSNASYKVEIEKPLSDAGKTPGMDGRRDEIRNAAVCIPWESEAADLKIIGDETLLKKIWDDVESFGTMYIWQILESF